MKCTAPVKGHRSPNARSRCPVCRGGGWRGPSGSHSTAPTQPASNGVRSRPTRGVAEVELRADSAESALVSAGLDPATSEKFTVALMEVASSLQAGASSRGKASHWLCELLAEAADFIDPGLVANAVGAVFSDLLVANGMPQWAAGIAGKGVAKASEATISSFMPSTQLSLGLRVLAVLVCPLPRSCPVEERVSVPILKDILSEF